MSLYLNVPYSEKDEAKRLGARWNAKVKRWYTDAPREKYADFAKWILRDSHEAVIAAEYLYIIEGEQTCWKCGEQTKVIGLGIGEYVHLYGENDDVQYEIAKDYAEPGEEVHLAWTADESEIPPKLLRYIKENYSVKTGYSKTLNGSCFANHCDCCGALQGNWFLFDEPDSPLSSCTHGDELIKRMRCLKIKAIPIDDDLQLNWNMGFCENDYAYLKYGSLEELVLSSDPDNEYVSFVELYGIRG